MEDDGMILVSIIMFCSAGACIACCFAAFFAWRAWRGIRTVERLTRQRFDFMSRRFEDNQFAKFELIPRMRDGDDEFGDEEPEEPPRFSGKAGST